MIYRFFRRQILFRRHLRQNQPTSGIPRYRAPLSETSLPTRQARSPTAQARKARAQGNMSRTRPVPTGHWVRSLAPIASALTFCLPVGCAPRGPAPEHSLTSIGGPADLPLFVAVSCGWCHCETLPTSWTALSLSGYAQWPTLSRAQGTPGASRSGPAPTTRSGLQMRVKEKNRSFRRSERRSVAELRAMQVACQREPFGPGSGAAHHGTYVMNLRPADGSRTTILP